MQLRLCASLCLLLAVGSLGDQTEVNPIRKITKMMEDMRSELEKEQENEKEIFEKAMCICESGEKELSTVISESQSEIERLTAKGEAETALKAKLDNDLKMHAKDKVDTEKSLEEAAAIREKDAAKFQEEESVNAVAVQQLGDAIQRLTENAGKSSFLQLTGTALGARDLKRLIQTTNKLNTNKRSAILNFLDATRAAVTAKTESSAADEIIGMMKAMHDEMSKDLDTLRSNEASEAQAFAEMKDNKEKHLMTLMKTLSDKTKRSGELALSISEDKDALEDAGIELENAQKYLASLQQQCEQRRKDRDMRNKMRSEEIAAISEAIKILTDDDALETFKKAVPSASLVQRPARSTWVDDWDSFLQRSSQTVRTAIKGPDAADHASQAAKVVDFMIDNMVETLHEDDVDDEHKKIWCANETEVMTQLRTDKQALTEQLTKDIEGMENSLEQLTADIKALKMDINSLDQEVFDATTLRKKEHEEFLSQYQAQDTAVKLVEKAKKRLNKFYSPNAALLQGRHRPVQAAPHVMSDVERRLSVDFDSFIQVSSVAKRKDDSSVEPVVLPDTPQTYEKKESGGVMGLMNEMVSELKMDMKSMEVDEKHAAADYKEMMHESKENRAAMVKALKNKKKTKAETEEKHLQATQQNDLTIEEVKHLDLYLAQLSTECDFLLRNFENRHEARISEEGGLKSAESIVTKEEVPSHGEIEGVFKSETSDKHVDQHFPDVPPPV